MGLSIHYSGNIRRALINDLTTETADICQSLNWKYNIITESGDESFNGIVFSPENCEPVFLTFLPNGKMCSPINLENKDFYAANGFDPDLIYTTSTKTQFAGPDTHIALLKLLRYLKEKYFENFELDDEGYYWNTNDQNILFQRFSHYNILLNAVSDALSNIKTIPGESPVSLTERIEKVLKEKFGKGNISD
jgi:hypothetical protein